MNDIIIIKKQNKQEFRFYSEYFFEEDKQRLVENTFYNSPKYNNNLSSIQHLGRITIDNDTDAYYKVNIIPCASQALKLKSVSRNQQLRLFPYEVRQAIRDKMTINTGMSIDQGWEILDDETFMRQYRQSYRSPRSTKRNFGKRQVKHREFAPIVRRDYKRQECVKANMIQTRVFHNSEKFGPARKESWRMPSLPEMNPSTGAIRKQLRADHHRKEVAEIEDLEATAPVMYAPTIKSITEIAPLLRWGVEFDQFTSHTPTEEEIPLEEVVPSLITKSIADMEFFKLLKCDTTFIASAITSSVLSIGTSLHTVFTTEPSTTSKVLNSVAIVSSLTTFCLGLNQLFDKCKLAHNTAKLYSQLPDLASKILNSAVKANSMMWIYPAISTLISLVIGALTTLNVCDVKSVIEKGRLLTATKAMTSTTNEVARFLLEDIAGLDVTGDQKAFNELHDWAKRTSELSVKSVMEFIQNAELNAEIHAAVSTTLPILTTKYKNKDMSHAARSAYQLILNNVSKLQEKIEAIKVIGDACKRIETFGVFLGGKKGVGKSRLCNYIAEYIANIMGLPKTMYNMNKSKDNGFYGPYGGAAFAEIQEFMALKDQDPNLPQLNQIISGDHFNLEAAHLNGKQQPFNARIVFLTANNLCPDLLRVLEIEAARATWDRILRFEVIDEAVQGRSGVNSHRRADFSHLTFNFVTSTDECNAANIVKREVTINEVLGIILYQTALRESQFIKSGIQSEVLKAEEVRKRLTFLEGILSRNDTKANSGQDFNVLRLEGPQRVGKTRLAGQISSYMHGILPKWPIKKVEQFCEKPSEKAIYIIDDLIETNYASYSLFLKWINLGHPDNFYIICTNHTYPQKWRRNIFLQATTPYWVIDTHGCSSGVARRLGLEGEMQLSDGSGATSSPRATQIYVSKPGSIKHQNEELTLHELKELVFGKFQDYLRCKELITVRHEVHTDRNVDFDCIIKAKTYEHFQGAFSSTESVMKARCGFTRGVSVYFKLHLIDDVTRHFRSEKQLLPGKIDSRDSLIDQAESIAILLNRAVPGLTARLVIEETGDDVVLIDRVLYVGTNIPASVLRTTHSAANQTITFTIGDRTDSITYKTYARFLKDGVYPEEMAYLQPEVVASLNTYVTDHISDSLFAYESFLADIHLAKQQFVEMNLSDFVKKRPFLTLITGLIALSSAGAVISLISKAFSKGSTKVSSNSAADEESCDPRVSIFAKRYKQAILQGDGSAKQIREEVAQAQLTRQFNQWEDEWRSNSGPVVKEQLPIALENGDIGKIVKMCELHPPTASVIMQKTFSNMLTMKDEKHQSSGPLEQLAERLRRNYVHVQSPYGNLYGLMIKGNLGITVAHCANNTTKTLVISSNGVEYTALIKMLSRERDLCTFRVIDKKWPAASDISNLFPTHGTMLDLTSGYYIRPTEKPLIVNAPVEYIDRYATHLIDNNNPFFRPEGKSWKFRLTGIASCASTFKIGDCGFPLVGSVDNRYYIIGIHNAFSVAGMGWFASVTQDDLQEIQSNSEPVRVAKVIKHPKLGSNMVLDDKMYDLVMVPYAKSVYEKVSALKVHGYNENLNFHSFPKHKKKYVDVAEKHLECQTTGSALDASQVTDTSKLVADSRGRIYPLFAQAVKYAIAQQREETFDAEIDAHASDYLAKYYSIHYPTGKILKPHEIINGLTYLKPLDMSTSAGPKMKKIFNINTKRPLNNENILFVNKSLKQQPWYEINTASKPGGVLVSDFSFYMSMIKQGKPICVVVKDNAKVELLPKVKVAQGKVRLFNEMDLSINMVLKAYWGDFLDKVMAKHDTTYFCIGMNPYMDASAHMFYFNQMDGDFMNADFESLDKTVTEHLVKDFVNCTLQHVTAESRDALTKTLVYRLHSMNGNVYFTDSGNASGSFVTTILNCHVVAKVSLYTFIRKYKEEFGYLPSYADISDNVILRILGDDGIRKYRQIFKDPITLDDLVADAARYRLKQTPAKTEGEVSFCSREYVPYKNVYFPRLKQSSITSCLFWFKSTAPEQVYQNCFTAMMEAGLWDKEFYTTITNTVIELSKVFKFKIDLASYELVQECWHAYISGKSSSPVWGRSDPECILEDINSNASSKNFIKMADMWLNEYVQKNQLEQPVYKYSAEGPDEALEWTCEASVLVNDELHEGQGVGTDKAEAKRNACDELRASVVTANSNVEIEWACYSHLGVEYHVKKCKNETKRKNSIFNSEITFMRYMRTNYPGITFLEKAARKDLMATRCITAIKTAIDGYLHAHVLPKLQATVKEFSQKLLDKERATREEMEQLDEILGDLETMQVGANMEANTDAIYVRANAGDMPIEPAVMNQAMNAQQASDLPMANNPQPTAQAPAVTAPGDDIMAAVQVAQETTLNPHGAPNMLSVGAIGFDLKMLIYEQFMDCDTEFSTTESAPTGAVIFQIPYAVMSQFTNYYIKAYASMHERYTGAIQFRITGIGNQLLSGAVGACWKEHRITESTILISEAQKIAYEMKGVNNPFNEIHTLLDARDTLFYRKVASDLTESLDDRPHLVVFVGMNVYNPYRDNTLVRFRVASKLSNDPRKSPFFFANPIRSVAPPPVAPQQHSSALTVSPASAFNEMFPQTLNTTIHVYTDGQLRRGVNYQPGKFFQPYTGRVFNNAAWRNCYNGTFRQSRTTTCVGDVYDSSELGTKWPKIKQYFTVNNVTTTTTTVGIVSQTTMDSANFATLLISGAYPGFGRINVVDNPKQDDWDYLKTINGWRTRPPYETRVPPNDIKINAILYNDAEISLGSFEAEIGRTFYYARFGQIKLVTNYGTAWFYLIASASSQSNSYAQNFGLLSESMQDSINPSMTVAKDLASYPNLNIDEQLGSLLDYVSLPLGYQALRFSDIPPSAITIVDYPGPTATDESCIERWFYNRSLDMPTTRCLEMTLVDVASQRIIATVRYYQEWRLFVVNSETANYKSLPFGTENIVIQSIVEIERVNAFPLTNTTDWFSRAATAATMAATQLVAKEDYEIVQANAALAMGAGMLSGLGSGLAKIGDRKHEKEMQANTFGHELSMQGNMFEQQTKMQGNQFGHNERMATMNQDFQRMMQGNNFQQEKDMTVLQANENRSTNRMDSQNRMTERGLGTRTNFLNTSFGTTI